jgi:integrase
MRGHIRKRERVNAAGRKTVRWYPIVHLGLDPNTGKYRYEEREGYTTKAEAETALNRKLADLGTGEFVSPTRLTLRRYLSENWLPTTKTRVKVTTWRNYSAMSERYLIPILGGKKLAEITAADANTLYARLSSGDLPVQPRRTRPEPQQVRTGTRKPRPRKNRGLSKKTVANVHVLLRKVLKDAVDEGLIARNPIERAKPPRATKPEIEAWSTHQLNRFLAAVADDADYALWHLLAMTGMRRGEALALRWSDLDLGAATVSIRRNLVLIGPSMTGFDTPKNGKARVLDLDEDTCAVLKAHRKRVAAQRLAYGVGYRRLDLVFPREDGSERKPDSVSRRFGVLRDQVIESKAIDKRITLHGLRHTHASIALLLGVHVKVVSERLGHSDPAFTMRTYQHLMPSMQRDAAVAIASAVRSAESDQGEPGADGEATAAN